MMLMMMMLIQSHGMLSLLKGVDENVGSNFVIFIDSYAKFWFWCVVVV